MMARRLEITLRKFAGFVFALGGTVLIVSTLPMYLWPLLLGLLLIWIGWQLFVGNRY